MEVPFSHPREINTNGLTLTFLGLRPRLGHRPSFIIWVNVDYALSVPKPGEGRFFLLGHLMTPVRLGNSVQATTETFINK